MDRLCRDLRCDTALAHVHGGLGLRAGCAAPLHHDLHEVPVVVVGRRCLAADAIARMVGDNRGGYQTLRYHARRFDYH